MLFGLIILDKLEDRNSIQGATDEKGEFHDSSSSTICFGNEIEIHHYKDKRISAGELYATRIGISNKIRCQAAIRFTRRDVCRKYLYWNTCHEVQSKICKFIGYLNMNHYTNRYGEKRNR